MPGGAEGGVKRLAFPTWHQIVVAAAVSLAQGLEGQGPYRLVGVVAFELGMRDGASQLDLLAPPLARADRLEAALDAVEERFGAGAVQRARERMRPVVVEGATDLDFLRDD